MPAKTTPPQPRSAAPDWIPCARELPDDETTVLIYSAQADPDVWVGFRDAGVWRDADTAARTHPTHWMPLPDGPSDL